MIAEKEAKKTHTRRQEMLQEMAQLIVLVRRTAAAEFKETQNQTALNDVSGFQSSERKDFTKTCTENIRKSRKSHGHHM